MPDFFVYIPFIIKKWFAFLPFFLLEIYIVIDAWGHTGAEGFVNRYVFTTRQKKAWIKFFLLGGFLFANFFIFHESMGKVRSIQANTDTYIKNRDFKNKILEFNKKLEEFEKEAFEHLNDPSDEYRLWLNGVVEEIVKAHEWLTLETTSKFADRIFYQVMPHREIDKDAKLKINERFSVDRKDLVGPVLEDLRSDIESKLIIGVEWLNYVPW